MEKILFQCTLYVSKYMARGNPSLIYFFWFSLGEFNAIKILEVQFFFFNFMIVSILFEPDNIQLVILEGYFCPLKKDKNTPPI
jgi:hypothetical protein